VVALNLADALVALNRDLLASNAKLVGFLLKLSARKVSACIMVNNVRGP